MCVSMHVVQVCELQVRGVCTHLREQVSVPCVCAGLPSMYSGTARPASRGERVKDNGERAATSGNVIWLESV